MPAVRRRRSLTLTAITAASALIAFAIGAGGAPLVAGSVAATVTDVVSSTPSTQWVPNDGVHALAQDDDWIYLGGAFTSLTDPTTKATFAAAGLVRLSITTGAPDPSWKPSVTGDVRTMVLDPATSVLYLGGEFTSVDGSARTDLGAVSTSGSGALSSWYPGAADKPVKSLIQLDSSTLMAGGGFQHIGADRFSHLVKISTAGKVDETFTPAINGSVYTISHPAGASYVYLGGLFTSLGSAERDYIGALDLSSGEATAWDPGNPCPKSPKVCPVFAFVPTSTAIYVATGGTLPSGSVVSYDPATAARNWTLTGDGDDQALALIGSELFVGGHFGPSFGGGTRTTLAGIDAATGTLAPFAPSATDLYPGTWALMSLPDGSLVVGGDQQDIGGTESDNYAVFPPKAAGSGAPTTQYVSDGSFEDAATTGWRGYNKSSTIKAVEPTAGAYDGNYALRVTNSTSASALVGVLSAKPQFVSSTVAGRTYTGSVWVSAAKGTALTLQLHECPATTGAACVGKSHATVKLGGSGWTQLSTTFTAVASGDTLRFAVFGTVAGNSRFRIDEASLTTSP